ncbi:MAG TPA: carboxypeptidase regulatory-like domain-containing protein [Blastocatellia bacterium]|nr:carboxypeptidase regulatory-like domain-containing protein [Blastocatellia bacterium]
MRRCTENRFSGLWMLRFALGALALPLLFMTGVKAQQAPARTLIRVLVQDGSGNPLPGASVELSHNGEVIATVTTDEKGEASASNFPPGSYQIAISKEGFETRTQKEVAVIGGQGLEIKFMLVPKVQLKEEVNVNASAGSAPPEQASSTPVELQRETLKEIAGKPTTVKDALPLIPGVVRSPQGEIKISGTGENRSAFVVNSADVTDPATGQFGTTVPVDSVQSINVFKTPYLAQYGRFTAGVVSVETRRGGDKWNFELNDPFPEFRYLGGRLRGLRTATPRVVFNGPLIKDRFYISQGTEYAIIKRPVQTLEYPNKESKSESVNSFTQLDYLLSDRHTLTGTIHVAPRKDAFVNLDFFNPRPVTPNSRGRDYTGTLIDRLTLGENLLESTIAVKRYSAAIWGQGPEDMILTPTGNLGNYFSQQDRRASRVEWLETLSLKPIRNIGTHNLKFGATVARTTNRGEFMAHPVDILDTEGRLLRRIEFQNGQPFDLDDFETYFYGQDHWNATKKLSVDVGLRFERQGITETYRFAPRLGVAYTPFGNQKTVLRGGLGYFYDRVPLGVYAFDKYPQQVMTTYDPNSGNVIDGPRPFANVIDQTEHGRNILIGGGSQIGNFAPYSSTWNVEVEHSFSPLVRLRANYLNSDSSGIVVVEPRSQQGQDAMVIGGGGQSSYRQLELTSRFVWGEGKQQIFMSYVRSSTRGDVNEFNTYIGNFPFPIVRPDQRARLSGDLPNRYLSYGIFHLPWKLRYSPIVEYRNGFPFSSVDSIQNYVGEANSGRYPNFFSFDSRVARDFQVHPKFAFRFTLSGFNLTNHFNALDVHRNVADPNYGAFFGNYSRFVRLDFDVIF